MTLGRLEFTRVKSPLSISAQVEVFFSRLLSAGPKDPSLSRAGNSGPRGLQNGG